MKAVILLSIAGFIATIFAPTWSNSPPGDFVHEGELERLAGLQCGYKTKDKEPCKSDNSVSSCGWWPCSTGACGNPLENYGYRCWTSAVGKACYNCSGPSNQFCATGGDANTFCYMTAQECCTSVGTCFQRVTPDPSRGTRRWACECDIAAPVIHETRTVTNITPDDPNCKPAKPPTYVAPEAPI
jgi:hypothetical protein